jgi:hypothetical protein
MSLRKGRVLDTVALRLTGTDFTITNPAKFGPARPLPGGGERRIQNATPQEKRAGVARRDAAGATNPWAALSSRPLSAEDEREIAENTTGFFSLLAEWDRADRRESGPPAGSRQS